MSSMLAISQEEIPDHMRAGLEAMMLISWDAEGNIQSSNLGPNVTRFAAGERLAHLADTLLSDDELDVA